MRASSVVVVAASVVGLAACKPKLEFHAVALPGFTLELPTSVHYTGDINTDYRQGKVSDIGDRTIVFVTWQPGEIITIDEMPMAIKAIGPIVPELAHMQLAAARSVEVNGQKATQLDASVEGVDLTFVDVTCGARSVMLGLGAKDGFAAFRDRILGSFHCQPDAAEDAALASSAPFGVDDPKLLAGWSRMPNDDAFAMTNGRQVVLGVGVPNGGKATHIVEKMIPALFQSAGATWQETGRTKRMGRELQRGIMTAEGDQTPALIATWTCDNGEDALLVLAIAPDEAGVTEVEDLVVKLRCARRGDPPLLAAPPKQ